MKLHKRREFGKIILWVGFNCGSGGMGRSTETGTGCEERPAAEWQELFDDSGFVVYLCPLVKIMP
jgi:hypothetical protein